MRDAVTVTTPTSDSAPPRRVWTTPLLKTLPKLSSLTLASPIGGGGGTGGGGSTVFGLLFALLTLAGCSAERGTSPSDGLPAPVKMQAVTCQVTVATSAVDCRAPQRAPGQEILGGQGSYLVLRSSNITSAAGVFSADISVQNLGAQPIGTPDGTTETGVIVFFESGPTVTGGTGNVLVANPSGTATFTAGVQPYFQYDTLLAALEESASMTWEWSYDVGVTNFEFTVLVAAEVPEVGGILRWSPVPGMEGVSIQAIALNGPDDVVAVGEGGRFARRTAAGWNSYPDPLVGGLSALSAVGGGKYVGSSTPSNQDGYVARFNGSTWSVIHTFPGKGVTAIYGAPTGEIFVVGYDEDTGDGFLSRFDGLVWHDVVLGGSPIFRFVDGTSATNVVAMTEEGLALRWDGATWTERLAAGGGSISALDVTGPDLFLIGGAVGPFGSEEAFLASVDGGVVDSLPPPSGKVVGGLGIAPGGGVLATVLDFEPPFSSWTLFRKWDGVSWATLDSIPGSYFGDPVSNGSGVYYLPGEEGVREWDGSGVSLAIGGPEVSEFNGVSVVGDHLFIAADEGAFWHYDGASWSLEYLGSNYNTSVWAFAENDVYVSSNLGVYHFDGVSWTLEPVNEVGTQVAELWGTGSTLFAVGVDTLFVKSGGVWTAHTDPLLGGNYYSALWGTGPTDVYLAGPGYDLKHWNGTSFSNIVLPPRAPGDSSMFVESISGTSATDIWLGTDDAGALHYDGGTVTLFGDDEMATIGAILPTGTGEAYLGTDEGIFRASVVGGMLRISSPMLDAGVGLAVGSGGKIWGVGYRTLVVGTR